MPASAVEPGSGPGSGTASGAPEFPEDTPQAITAEVPYLTNLLVLPGLVLLGVLGLFKAMAGQCYRYPLLGPVED